jgi:hypothetical protein
MQYESNSVAFTTIMITMLAAMGIVCPQMACVSKLELRPLCRLMFDSIALDCQVAPEVVATAEREKSGSDIRQAGDATKSMDPQKQAAEAMRQTAELAKQVLRHVVMMYMSPNMVCSVWPDCMPCLSSSTVLLDILNSVLWSLNLITLHQNGMMLLLMK